MKLRSKLSGNILQLHHRAKRLVLYHSLHLLPINISECAKLWEPDWMIRNEFCTRSL